MGTDIHPIAQIRDDINSRWRNNTDKVFRNRYYDYYKDMEATKGIPVEIPEHAKEGFIAHPDPSRNYDWFAILADVRNGSGFAGVKTGDGFAIIAEPRGIPYDYIMPTDDEDEDEFWLGDHSHSYVTLEDFDDFNWDQTTTKQGVIPIGQYVELRKTGKNPDSYSGWISGPNVEIIKMDAADKLLDTGKAALLLKQMDGKSVNVLYKWEVNYREYFKTQLEYWVEPLRELTNKYGKGNARIVFGFDS